MKLRAITESDYDGLPDEDSFGNPPPPAMMAHDLGIRLMNGPNLPVHIDVSADRSFYVNNYGTGGYYSTEMNYETQEALEVVALDCNEADGHVTYY